MRGGNRNYVIFHNCSALSETLPQFDPTECLTLTLLKHPAHLSKEPKLNNAATLLRFHTSPAAIKRNTTTAVGVSSCDAPQPRRPVKRGALLAPLDLNFQEAFQHLVVSPAEKTPTPAASCTVAFITVPFYLLQGKRNKTFEKQSKKKTVRGSTSQPRAKQSPDSKSSPTSEPGSTPPSRPSLQPPTARSTGFIMAEGIKGKEKRKEEELGLTAGCSLPA